VLAAASGERLMKPLVKLMTVVLAVLAIAGCASVPPDQALLDATTWAARAQAPAPTLAESDTARAALQAERARLLGTPLTERAAVELALRSSPAAQALLAEGWQLQATTAQRGAWPSPTLALERLTQGADVARTTTLTLGLTELLTLPWRQAGADRQVQAQRLQLASDLLARDAAVRAQWVRAVAARQLLQYHRQVHEAAQASAELAQRLQAAGNFSRLQQARQQAFLVDASGQLARGLMQATTEREALVRLLGLTGAEAASLQWPERLPELPAALRTEEAAMLAASGERLDLQIARAQWQGSARAEGLVLPALLDAELARGVELTLALPLPGTAALRSQGATAATLAAAQRLEQVRIEASSTVRERHAAYAAAHEIALRHRDEIVPLRKAITDEMLLKVNGMLVGVFDLLADARLQAGAVISAIEAQRDFWLANAALDAAILGTPAVGLAPVAGMAPNAQTQGPH
jgi:outer membrane protein TolC